MANLIKLSFSPVDLVSQMFLSFFFSVWYTLKLKYFRYLGAGGRGSQRDSREALRVSQWKDVLVF